MASGDASLSTHGRALAARVARLADVTAQLWAAGDPAVTLANASVYLEAFGHVVLAWIWLEQAMLAQTALAALPSG
ncbi:acyl-CoA dehydrogenase C-terminal domain-containing protein, partial [Acinetobacter baumannii]